MKKKEIIVILLLVLLIFILLFIKKNIKSNDRQEIENEDYYIEKSEEYEKYSDEYNEMLSEYIENNFSSEEKAKIEEYNEILIACMGDKEREKIIEDQKQGYIKQVSETRFTEEQKNKLSSLQEKMNELEPAIDEYNEKQIEQFEKKFWDGLEKLSDGTIVNKRESVIGDKECDGLLFTNISLRYDSNTKKSYLGANVKNISNKSRDKKAVSAKITGDVNLVLELDIEGLLPDESYDFEIDVTDNISMAGTLEIIPYNEADYQNNEISTEINN